MDNITWEDPFCGEGASCFRFGTDTDGNAYIAVQGQEAHAIRDTREALQNLIRDIKSGMADHLL